MEDSELDVLGDHDDVGYYDYDGDWGATNAADGAFCPEALDSCWDKSGRGICQYWDHVRRSGYR